MKTSELRIGNAVQIKGPEFYYPIIIKPRILIDIWEGVLGECPENILPIPITLSQMERLGFEYRNRQYTNIKDTTNETCKYKFILTTADNIELYAGSPYGVLITRKKFKYIHEIQNVWYELTGEELTYKID